MKSQKRKQTNKMKTSSPLLTHPFSPEISEENFKWERKATENRPFQ